MNQLAALGQTSIPAQTGDPEAKKCNAYGPPIMHCLGLSKRTVTGTGRQKEPIKCKFCGVNGHGKIHSRKKVCPLKNSYGECIDMKKTHSTKVGDDSETIFQGNHGFRDASTLGDFSDHHCIDDDLPKGTRSVQIKAFMVRITRFLLCTCLNVGWKILQIQGKKVDGVCKHIPV